MTTKQQGAGWSQFERELLFYEQYKHLNHWGQRVGLEKRGGEHWQSCGGRKKDAWA
ncbi:hypothetical protein C2E23DRAFT_822706 [Lenzites betulinus]|nr:hypothetical protein C2E23DRAFT_822706 [Lenzites betulinus]